MEVQPDVQIQLYCHFALSRPPQHIKAGYIRLPVELYIPNPLRCYKCGHGSNTCRGSAVCVRCGATDQNDSGCIVKPL